MSLSILVSQDKWQDFDNAWAELMVAKGPVDDLLRALRLVGDKKRMPRCIPLVKEHTALLAEGGRAEDAAKVLGAALQGGASGAELGDSLYEYAKSAWGDETWWPNFTDLSGLTPDASDIRRAWTHFERLCSFQTGGLVFHPGGWGTGEVLEMRPESSEMVVQFANGRKDTFPLSGAVDIFQTLDESDLRAMYFRDRDGMKKRLKEEPLEILRAVLNRYHGRATLISIRNALMQVGVEGSGWTAWWRKARKLASNSEWFRVTGTAQRGEVQLLLSAADTVAETRRELSHFGTLAELLGRARDLLAGGDVNDELRAAIFQAIDEMAKEPHHPEIDRFSAWLMLREETGETPEEMKQALEGLRSVPAPEDPAEPPALWSLFAGLGLIRDQERCVSVIKELYPDDWLEQFELHLQHAAHGMLRPMMEALSAAKKQPVLIDHYRSLLARPLRSPHVLVGLAKTIEKWDVDPAELPTRGQRAQALLSLATFLWLHRRGNQQTMRVHTRLVELLSGADPLLPKLAEGLDNESLASIYRIAARGVDEAVDYMVNDLTRHAVETDEGKKGFWEDGRIWTTRAGLERRRAELRELHDVKIPENTEAIGRAAAMGDLSENAEWEAAIEEQGNLTRRAAEIEAELKVADLIEEVAMPEDTVCPGTRVTYKNRTTGETGSIQILGPWDTDRADDVVSYRAPLAGGLLGLSVGDKAEITLPTGEIEVEVLQIETVPLG